MTLSMKESPTGLVFKIRVQPRSSKNAVVGIHGDALKIKLTAPPVGGKANKACLQFLARCLGIAKTDLEIVSGQTSRTKHIHLAFPSGEAATKDEKARLTRLLRNLADE